MKTSIYHPLLAFSIAVFALSSCATSGDEYSYEPLDYYKSAGDSAPGYSDDDFYYYESGGISGYYQGSFIVGNSYYCGSGDCPICHRHPCAGHKGRSSSWSHHSGNSLAHRESDHQASYSVAQHDKGDHHASIPSRSPKDKNDHAASGRGTKPAPFSAAEIKELRSLPSNAGSSSSSSSTSSSGRGSSSKKKDKDDDDKKKKN